MKEKTVAMATDELSSLKVTDNDIFSKIPEHIIHCIFGFLPSIKDVIRTSSISKSCHQAWRTFQISEFNLRDFSSEIWIRSIQEQFIRFVDKTLQNSDGMKIFNLTTRCDMAHHHSTRWIGMALDNKVEHLALVFFQDSRLPCLIPDRILSAYWLKSLKLVGSTICVQSLSETSRVDLPSLTSLHIQYCDPINHQQLQKLLSGCPALVEIALLECVMRSKVDISEHPNLETLEIKVSEGTRVDHVGSIMVRAPKLKSFSYEICDNSWCDDVVVNIHNSSELKSLRIRDENKTDEWFDKFITQFPLLENLTIDRCYKLSKIRISNPLLQKIKIRYCHRLEDVLISSKMLNSFCLFTPYSSIPNPTIRMEMDNPPTDFMANISNPYHVLGAHMMEAIWYCKLKEFLSGPFTFKSLIINMSEINAEDGDMNAEDVHKELPHTACNIEKLVSMLKHPHHATLTF